MKCHVPVPFGPTSYVERRRRIGKSRCSETRSYGDSAEKRPGASHRTKKISASKTGGLVIWYPVRARSGNRCSEGRSGDEAIERLRALAQKRFAAGHWQHVSLPGPPQANPWIAF